MQLLEVFLIAYYVLHITLRAVGVRKTSKNRQSLFPHLLQELTVYRERQTAIKEPHSEL